MIESAIESSMIRKAVDNGILDIHIVNPRDFSKGSYQQIDDTPFGGGPGMVMMAEPLFKAIDFVIDKFSGEEGMRVLYPSPQGIPWSQSSAEENKDIDKIVIICGHYKGVDQRVIDKYVTHEYSMGDFVSPRASFVGFRNAEAASSIAHPAVRKSVERFSRTGGFIIEIKKEIYSHAKGAKRYRILPVGETIPLIVEERFIKLNRHKK